MACVLKTAVPEIQCCREDALRFFLARWIQSIRLRCRAGQETAPSNHLAGCVFCRTPVHPKHNRSGVFFLANGSCCFNVLCLRYRRSSFSTIFLVLQQSIWWGQRHLHTKKKNSRRAFLKRSLIFLILAALPIGLRHRAVACRSAKAVVDSAAPIGSPVLERANLFGRQLQGAWRRHANAATPRLKAAGAKRSAWDHAKTAWAYKAHGGSCVY